MLFPNLTNEESSIDSNAAEEYPGNNPPSDGGDSLRIEGDVPDLRDISPGYGNNEYVNWFLKNKGN